MGICDRYIVIEIGQSRHRVITMSTPRMAAPYTFQRQPSTPKNAMFLQSLNRILGATGRIAACGRQNSRWSPLPQPGDKDQQCLHLIWPCGLSGSLSDVLSGAPFALVRARLRRPENLPRLSPLPALARRKAWASSSESWAKSRSTPPLRPINIWS